MEVVQVFKCSRLIQNLMVGICNSIGLIPLLLRELSRWNPAQAAVGPDFVPQTWMCALLVVVGSRSGALNEAHQ